MGVYPEHQGVKGLWGTRTKMIEDSKLAQPRYKGMTHGVRMIVAEEGYRGLYRGVGPVVSPNIQT